MKSKRIMIPLFFFFVLNTISTTIVRAETDLDKMKSYIQQKYAGQHPKLWVEKLPGVIFRLPTNEKVVALTFDAGGGPKGSGYDAE